MAVVSSVIRSSVSAPIKSVMGGGGAYIASFLSLLPAGFAFARASTGAYYDSGGTLVSAAIDAARFDYNPATLAQRGLRMEDQSSNLQTVSVPNTTDWFKTAVTIDANQLIAPNGTLTASKITENTATSQHNTNNSTTVSYTVNKTYTLSMYAKAGTETVVQLTFGSVAFGGLGYANFNLSAGTVSTGGTLAGYGITPINNEWYRIWITAVATGTSSISTGGVYLANNNASATRVPSYTGTNKYLYAWGSQVEESPFPTSYIATAGSTATRAVDLLNSTSIPWFNSTEGYCVAEFDVLGAPTTTRRLLSLNDGTSNNSMMLSVDSDGKVVAGNVIGGSATASGLSSALTANTVAKALIGWKNGQNIAYVNGVALSAGTFGGAAVPSGINRLDLFNRAAGDLPLSGHLRSLKCGRFLPSAAQAAALTGA